MKYIAYYRVSTQRQGVSGLGLEAQQAAVMAFIGKGDLIAEYTDVESGKNNTRPEVLKALQHCKNTNATLVIAKLDRLSRNMTFISTLMDSKARFVCADMPDATELTIHIFAAIAQHERKAISTRTKVALQALKDRGVKLGKPENMTDEGRKKGVETLKRKSQEKKDSSTASALARMLRENGATLKEIADRLNKTEATAPKGGKFTPTQVARMC